MRVAILVLLAGCIEADLVPCGDQACPAGTQCGPYGGCVAPAQLTACGDLAPGDPCTFDGVDGLCRDELCEPVGCGNNVQSVDEVCDDGNTRNGDGCAADCRSLEVCGNAISDFGAGEECDDGNTADGDDCLANCKLPRCGDGRVDGGEECDPQLALTTDRTCADFGYYAGDLGCSSICRLAPTNCVGRCGDGIVQAQVEGCDGGPPTDSCMDYGFDVGALTCSAVCTADPNRSCGRFGWVEIGSVGNVGAPSIGFAGEGNTVARYGFNLLQMFDNGVASQRALPTQIVDIDMNGSLLVVATSTVIERRASAAAAVETLPQPPFVAGSQIVGVAVGEDDSVFALVPGSTGCIVHRLDGATWTPVVTHSGCMNIVARSSTNFAVQLSDTNVAWTTAGVTRSIALAATVRSVRFAGDAALEIYRSASGTITCDTYPPVGPPVPAAVTSGLTFAKMAFAERTVYSIDSNAFAVRAYRGVGGRTESFAGAPSTTGVPSQIYTSRDNQVYAESNSSLYRLVNPSPTARAAINDFASDSAVALAADGAFVFCGRQINVSAGLGYVSSTATTGSSVCLSTWARAATEVYAARTINGITQLWRFDGVTATVEQLAAQPIAAVHVSGDATTTVAVLTNGTVARKTAAWELLPALPGGCTALVGAIETSIYAGGVCGSEVVIWRLDGAAWTELRRRAGTIVYSLHVTPSGQIFAATSAGVEVGSGATWTLFPIGSVQLAGAGSAVYATTVGTSNEALLQWSTDRFTAIRTPPEPRFTKIAAGKTDVVMIGAINPSPLSVAYGLLLPPR